MRIQGKRMVTTHPVDRGRFGNRPQDIARALTHADRRADRENFDELRQRRLTALAQFSMRQIVDTPSGTGRVSDKDLEAGTLRVRIGARARSFSPLEVTPHKH